MGASSTFLVRAEDSGLCRIWPFATKRQQHWCSVRGLRFRGSTFSYDLRGMEWELLDAWYIVDRDVTAYVCDLKTGRRGMLRPEVRVLEGDVFGDLEDARPIRVPERTRRRD